MPEPTPTYALDECGGMCPTQATGTTADRRPFYFRARHGTWTLQVGSPGGTVHDAVGGEMLAYGDDPTYGSMSESEVRAILDEHLR